MGQNTVGANSQMTQFAVVMFGSIVSSVAVSTLIIMSLMGGPAAGALQTQSNTTQSGVSANMCFADPAEVADEEAVDVASAGVGGGAFVGSPAKLAGKGYLLGNVSGSFNTTNHSSTTTSTTNTFTNTDTRTTTIVSIRDNGNSYSASWNNGNTINSGNSNHQAWNNGNDYSDNRNQGNDNSNHQSSTTTNTTTNTTVTVRDNGNTNNQTWNQNNNSTNNSGNTNVNVSDNGNTNNQNNNNTNNQNNGNNNGVIVEDNELDIL